MTAQADDRQGLARFGLTLKAANGPEGGVYEVSGETYPVRHVMRETGGQWDRDRQVWVFASGDPTGELVARLNGGVPAYGLSDAAQETLKADKPHYWGHRQRLRERFLATGDTGLPDYELLELLLFFCVERVDTKPLAKKLLERFGGLGGAINARDDQLLAFAEELKAAGQIRGFAGLNQHTLALFKAVRVFAIRLAREELSEQPVLDTWDKLIQYLRASMAHLMVEQFRVLFLDRRNVLIADEVQHQGTIDHTPVYPREVVRRALSFDASALVMVHNHPSNHPKPSKADIQMTRQIIEALDKVGIVLHDHLIISRKGHSSLRQMGLLG